MHSQTHSLDARHPLPSIPLPPPSQSKLFSPLKVGSITLPNRVWLPAMVTWLSNEDGEVTPAVEARYVRYAKGEPGMIVLEAMGIRDVRSGPLMRIGHDRCIPGLKGLVQKIHDTSESKVIPQIIDFLKISVRDPQKYLSRLMPRYPAHPELLHYDEATLERLLTPREWQDYRMGYRQRVEDLSRDELTQLPGLFARAARRAREAGFDGVELHFAHAYTLASFLSRTNRRTDEYGGPALENRLRLPLEVIKAVRLEVGHDFTLGLRFLGSEDVEGGSELEDACAFAVAFAKAGVDFISVSRGGRFDDARQPRIGEAAYPYTGHSGLMCMPTHAYQEGYNLHLPAGIRAAVRAAGFETPVVGAGRLNTYAIAETALQTGALDLVGMARGLLADPDWPRKTRDGTGEIHYCKYNNICEALDRKHLPVRCQLWMKKPVGQLHAPEDW